MPPHPAPGSNPGQAFSQGVREKSAMRCLGCECKEAGPHEMRPLRLLKTKPKPWIPDRVGNDGRGEAPCVGNA